jgi:hypothetical protein
MRKMTMILSLLTVFMFASAASAGCPHHAKKDTKVEHDCMKSHKGINWTITDVKGGAVAEATIPGCPKRSAAIRAKLVAEIPKCKTEKCNCKGKKDHCPFAVDGVDFKVDNGDKALKVTATSADPKKLEVFKTRIKAMAEAAKGTGTDCGCGCDKK